MFSSIFQTNNFFADTFPRHVFGQIPAEVINLLQMSGFENLVTIRTLNNEDIKEIETVAGNPLKLGHKRLIMQMVEYAKKIMPSLEVDREHFKKFKAPVSTTVNSEKDMKSKIETETKEVPKKVQKVQKDENIVTMLKQTLKKTAVKFCQTNKIDEVTIADVIILRSSDNVS